jgi:hypothetical protein
MEEKEKLAIQKAQERLDNNIQRLNVLHEATLLYFNKLLEIEHSTTLIEKTKNWKETPYYYDRDDNHRYVDLTPLTAEYKSLSIKVLDVDINVHKHNTKKGESYGMKMPYPYQTSDVCYKSANTVVGIIKDVQEETNNKKQKVIDQKNALLAAFHDLCNEYPNLIITKSDENTITSNKIIIESQNGNKLYFSVYTHKPSIENPNTYILRYEDVSFINKSVDNLIKIISFND